MIGRRRRARRDAQRERDERIAAKLRELVTATRELREYVEGPG